MSLDGPHGRPSGGASLRAWSTTSRSPRIAGPGRGVGAQAPPRRSPAPAHPVLPHLPGTTGGRMDAPEPTAGHHSDTPPGQPSKMDTLAWPAGRRERTPRRTATATDRMLDACSSGRLQSSIRAGWPGSTNDERPSPPMRWAAAVTVRQGVRPGQGSAAGYPSGVQPSRAGASIPAAMVRVMAKRLARQSPSRACERPAWPHDVIRRFLDL